MKTEEQFYNTLAQAPELPAELFTAVQHHIHRRNVVTRAMWSFAALLVFVTGALFTNTIYNGNNAGIEPEIADELQIIRDYLNGDDVSNGIDTYAEAYFER